MESSLIGQGIALMLVGMGTVFVFLTLLVASMSAMSAAVSRFAPPALPPAPSGRPASEDPAVVAAIVAAVELHRRGGRAS